jgi:hypothetical protein
MPQFMVMVLEDEAKTRDLPPSETKALVEAYSAYERKLRAASVFLDGERLRPSAEGKRVTLHDGSPHINPGPFGDKALSGYYVLEATGLDAALELAEACPLPPGAELDVRPIMKGSHRPDKTREPGRVFAFAVLGNAPSEQSWIDVMDRIDESTTDAFPAGRARGGVRLLEPGRGRRVSSTGGRRAVFDGPFLESKEVIGGYFFLRMASMGEAVDWASRSEFAKHGTLEIRELWRS